MSVTTPAGFRASGVTAGLKPSGAPDVALVVCDGPSYAAAGVFTTNRFAAAPVLWSRQVLASGRASAVVLNSGGANAATGPAGFADTHATAEHVAGLLGHNAAEVAVCSTGLIGQRLAMDRLLAGTGQAVAALSADGGPAAARAIMTTDTVPKQAVSSRGEVDRRWSVGGMAKGAGMIAPALATMLVVLTTDAVVEAPALDQALRAATATTFDRIDVDGCMSTNDTVLLLASGASGIAPDEAGFAAAVREVCDSLARQIVADAEGASKEIEIRVTGAASEGDALEVARAVGRSNLLKCAIHGGDPNWGRVVSAVGTTAAAFEPENVGVAINGIAVCRQGCLGEDPRLVDMAARQVCIEVSLGAGAASAALLTNDLTADYVHENSAYST